MRAVGVVTWLLALVISAVALFANPNAYVGQYWGKVLVRRGGMSVMRWIVASWCRGVVAINMSILAALED
jgi:hypothetical protein